MRRSRARRAGLAAVFAVVVSAVVTAAASPARPDAFVLHRLVADPGFGARLHDPQLVNAWGLAASGTGPWWVANEARGTSTLYAGDGRKQVLTVQVPGGPTGVVFNGGSGFVVRGGGRSAPARFLYACEDGRIRGWAPTVPHGWSSEAVVAVDASGSGAIFHALALSGGRLYATDFHRGRVLVFDSHWRPVVRTGAFRDPAIPAGYSPFGILAAGGRLFVSYALPAPVDGNDAPSGGYVDEFDRAGRLVARVGRGLRLDEPWGLALAPRGFGALGGDLLVANFGSGRIDAFARAGGSWRFAGELRGSSGAPLVVPGLWGIAFGNGGMSGPRTTLFATAGPHRWHGASEESVHGLLAAIAPAS
ncbi:MAG TPA: TIGR03118 family protein [Gaiellaceae bacterium]|nr:TIGR03118 family protein [Gaiellaceae bacterium]